MRVVIPQAVAESSQPRLIRAIGRWALTAGVMNSVIGTGVFGLPAPLAALVGEWSPAAVLLAGGCVFVIVLCFAEVGGRFDQAGGPYLYTREAFGALAGFQIGWLHIWTRLFAGAAALNVLASYLAALVPWAGTTPGRAVSMTAAMTLVTVVNVRGVREAAWMVNVLTVAKILPLAAIVLVGAFQIDREVFATQAVIDRRWTEAVLLLVFGYGGFESAVIAGSESRDPKRDTPFALITAMMLITVLYSLVQLTVVGVLPNAAASGAPIGATLGILIGPAGSVVGTLAVLISVYGWLTGFALMTPRILFSMGERNELPAMLAHVHPRMRTPDVAIIVNSVIALALGIAGGFGQLATFSAIARLGIYALTCGALIALRRKWGMPERFRTPGGPALAATGIAFSLWLFGTRSLAQAWFLPIVLACGGLIWLAMKRQRALLTQTIG